MRIATTSVDATPCLCTSCHSPLHRAGNHGYAAVVISSLGPAPTGRTSDVARDGAASARQSDQETQPKQARPDKARGGRQLTAEQLQVVSRLQSRDREVRAHESAHKAAGGSLAGGVSLSYQTGPDGRSYAIGGEVSIDSGAEREPQATITKMQRVIAAALAPADPSAQDQAVAAQAQSTMAAAMAQLSEQRSATSTKMSAGPDGEAAPAKGYGTPAESSGGLLDLIA